MRMNLGRIGAAVSAFKLPGQRPLDAVERWRSLTIAMRPIDSLKTEAKSEYVLSRRWKLAAPAINLETQYIRLNR
jgi:hypothetical protein